MTLEIYTRKDLLTIARQIQDAIDALKKAKEMMSEDIDENNRQYYTTNLDKAVMKMESIRDEYTNEHAKRVLELMKG